MKKIVSILLIAVSIMAMTLAVSCKKAETVTTTTVEAVIDATDVTSDATADEAIAE